MRRRGRVPRIHMKKEISTSSLAKNQNQDGTMVRPASGADHPPRKRVMPSAEVANIPRYSARKKRANLKPEYSMKYPAIISDSPSGRSKGERLDSAGAAMRNRTNPTMPQGVKRNQCGKMPV